ncbi:hypothetical protein C8J57DRAFT_1286692 [Mycena rebaudengoi]|nr:hypothetical protein C8J57DRAFT_1286692 [Mycena rebaudengoi]
MLHSPPSPPPRPKRCPAKRPRGLWKGRGTDRSLDPDRSPRNRQLSDETDSDDDTYLVLEYEDTETMDVDVGTQPTNTEDWDDLKELFARAADRYEADDVPEALPLLRGVIHECHRILILHEDPSVLWAKPVTEPTTSKKKKCKCKESPTAFHAIFGTALFLFANLIAQDPTVALPDEPSTPAPYWLAALDVFETGENLPSRTSGRGCESVEDWRMAVIWGRTLVCVADEAVTLQDQLHRKSASPPAPEPKYPPASPFSTIAMRRPPASRRITVATADPHALLLLAMDQFTRGIFHMPHPSSSHARPTAPSSLGLAPPAEAGAGAGFSRAKELYTIAAEVLALAERLPKPLERQRWAQWADNVLTQILMDSALVNGVLEPSVVARARGRAWLVVGTARVEEIEAMAEERGWDDEDGENGIYDCEEAEEAREGLERAIEFFERAMGGAPTGEGEDDADTDAAELRSFLAEALLTLANLTKDTDAREELYRRAQLLGSDLEDMGMDVTP